MTAGLSVGLDDSTRTVVAFELQRVPQRASEEAPPHLGGLPSDQDAAIPITYPENYRLVVITIGLTLSVFLAALDSTILATAIPSITSQFGSISNIAWYGSSYVITNTAFQSSWGKAYNYFPIKHTFLAAIAVFEAGNVISAVSKRSEVLILGRCVAGLGGGGVLTGSFVAIALSVRDQWRAAYMGLVGVTFGVASVAGPLMGGALVDGVGWRWCFWINLPIGFVAAAIIFFAFENPIQPREATLRERITQTDPQGGMIITGMLSCFVLAMHWTGVYAWSSPRVVGALSGFVLLLLAFILNKWMMGSKAMVQAHLLRKPVVLMNSLYAFFLAGACFPLLYILPVHFQSVDNNTATESGIRLIPLVLGVSIFTMLANGLVTFWHAYSSLLLAGALCATIGLSLIHSLDPHASARTWIGYELLTASGIGLALQIPMISNQANVPASDLLSATSLALFMENCGTAVFMASGESAFVQGLIGSLKKSSPSMDTNHVLDAGATQIRQIYQGTILERILDGYLDGCRISYVICLACAVTASIVAMTSIGLGGVKWRVTKIHRT